MEGIFLRVASIDACQTRRLDVAAAILSPVDAEMICLRSDRRQAQ